MEGAEKDHERPESNLEIADEIVGSQSQSTVGEPTDLFVGPVVLLYSLRRVKSFMVFEYRFHSEVSFG